MLTLCASSTERDYTTTGAVMRELFGATTTAEVATTQEINRISDLIRRASDWADRYVGRPFHAQVYAETLSADGGNILMVSRRPVNAVLRLFDATDTGSATEYCSTMYRLEDADAGFIGSDGGFAWTAQWAYGETPFSFGLSGVPHPGRLERPWLVEYAAGYVPIAGMTSSHSAWASQATSTERTLPGDVEQAVILKVLEWYRGADAAAGGVRSETVGDLSVSYGDAQTALSNGGPAARLLDPYRSIL